MCCEGRTLGLGAVVALERNGWFRIHLEVGLFLCPSSSLIAVYFSFPTFFLRFFFLDVVHF